MDFSLSEEHRMIQQSVRKFCERELEPITDELDRGNRFPMDVYRKAGQEGFIGGGTQPNLQKTGLFVQALARELMREI